MAEFNLSSLAIPIGLSRRGFVCSLNQPPKGRFLQAKHLHIRTSSDFKHFTGENIYLTFGKIRFGTVSNFGKASEKLAEFNLSSLAISIGLSRRGFVCSLNQPPKPSRYTLG